MKTQNIRQIEEYAGLITNYIFDSFGTVTFYRPAFLFIYDTMY